MRRGGATRQPRCAPPCTRAPPRCSCSWGPQRSTVGARLPPRRRCRRAGHISRPWKQMLPGEAMLLSSMLHVLNYSPP